MLLCRSIDAAHQQKRRESAGAAHQFRPPPQLIGSFQGREDDIAFHFKQFVVLFVGLDVAGEVADQAFVGRAERTTNCLKWKAISSSRPWKEPMSWEGGQSWCAAPALSRRFCWYVASMLRQSSICNDRMMPRWC